MFWGYLFICEEFTIPAIMVFCKRNGIPADISGAILIGAGLSTPSLFSSYVGLFVSKSAIGIGTIIGADLFCHLIIFSGSILSAPNHVLKLDKVIFTRETLFYYLSNLLLIWAVSEGSACFLVNLKEAVIIVANYALYCVFEVYFPNLSKTFLNVVKRLRSTITNNEDIKQPEHPDVEINEDFTEIVSAPQPVQPRIAPIETMTTKPPQTDIEMHLRQSFASDIRDRSTSTAFTSLSEIDDVSEFEAHIRNEFYARNNCGGVIPASRVWQSNSCVLDRYGLYYRTDPTSPARGPHVHFVDLFLLQNVSQDPRKPEELLLALTGREWPLRLRFPGGENCHQSVRGKLKDFIDRKAACSELEIQELRKEAM